MFQAVYLLNSLSSSLKLKLLLSVFLTILSAASEMMTIGIFYPIISQFLGEPIKSVALTGLINYFNIGNDLITIFLIVFTVASIFRIYTNWFVGDVSAQITNFISNAVFFKIIKQDLIFHKSTSSASTIGLFTRCNSLQYNIINPVLSIVSYAIITAMIIIMLLLIDMKTTAAFCIYIGLAYIIVNYLITKQLGHFGKLATIYFDKELKHVIESIGCIRDVKLDRSENICYDKFCMIDNVVKKSVFVSGFLTSNSKNIIEYISVIGIFIYLFFSGKADLSLVGTLVLGFQRIVPNAQGIFNSYSTLKVAKYQLSEIIQAISLPLPISGNEPVWFERDVLFSNITFSYNDKNVITNLNCKISKGDKIAVIGKSGSGKSTYVDILMGFIIPNCGFISVDSNKIDKSNNASWMSLIAHVPQSVYLLDDTILTNISLKPASETDMSRLIDICRRLKISKFIEDLPEGYNTRIGERGGLLSGGQVQRIGIARALYKDLPLLVLDEATSSLDHITEKEILEALFEENSSLTVVFITHRKAALKYCNKVFDLELINGNV